MTTYGFEAEFTNNAAAVIAGLHERGLAGDRTLHGYHCDCDYCMFNNGHAFRGQTDSSCSGEIISDIFGGGNYGDEFAMMNALADTAVEVDAEPGPNSGFHVHVGVNGLTQEDLADALWQFVRWEPVLHRIAGGRWSERRGGMNTAVRDNLQYTLTDYGGGRMTTGGLIQFEEGLEIDSLDRFKQAMLYRATDCDRHSNLNIGQHSHPTWEFRIWNSTRSAWRMGMFCGLSVALMDPAVVDGLSELAPPIRMARPNTGIADIALACANAGHDGTAELLERQGAYLNHIADNPAPSVLTAS